MPLLTTNVLESEELLTRQVTAPEAIFTFNSRSASERLAHSAPQAQWRDRAQCSLRSSFQRAVPLIFTSVVTSYITSGIAMVGNAGAGVSSYQQGDLGQVTQPSSTLLFSSVQQRW